MSIMTPIEKARLTPKMVRSCPTGCMLLGNANVNYDPDHHITDKNLTCLDWGHCWYKVRQHPSFDPVYESEATGAAVCYSFRAGSRIFKRIFTKMEGIFFAK